ncbi:phosphatidylinositol 3-kinase [Anopheles sinensis]|uniref:Phosphatidylinositol 3-kinase n=1 Tax=Anopheles sinensis TaxID=74873 RepID=A0A084W7X9_ANOSI|nr:phosphatidylinositol 3-kinase [Anopheles sinensis]
MAATSGIRQDLPQPHRSTIRTTLHRMVLLHSKSISIKTGEENISIRHGTWNIYVHRSSIILHPKP